MIIYEIRSGDLKTVKHASHLYHAAWDVYWRLYLSNPTEANKDPVFVRREFESPCEVRVRRLNVVEKKLRMVEVEDHQGNQLARLWVLMMAEHENQSLDPSVCPMGVLDSLAPAPTPKITVLKASRGYLVPLLDGYEVVDERK